MWRRFLEEVKTLKSSVWVSMDACRRMVGLWVWLVLPGSAGADLSGTYRLRNHMGAATWAQERRISRARRQLSFIYNDTQYHTQSPLLFRTSFTFKVAFKKRNTAQIELYGVDPYSWSKSMFRCLLVFLCTALCYNSWVLQREYFPAYLSKNVWMWNISFVVLDRVLTHRSHCIVFSMLDIASYRINDLSL